MQHTEVPAGGAAVRTNTTPRSAYSQPSIVFSPTPTVNNTHKPIYFYNKHEPYYFLTNFAPHSVEWKGRVYQTAEHLFQAFKFIHQYPEIAEDIRLCQSPREALAKARQHKDYVRTDWFDGVNIETMKFVLKLKFRQHKDLWRKLLATRGHTLVENAGSKDKFWGNGADGQGENWLGRLLMEVRDEHAI
ncbi:DUF1768-domain-containing protein [Peniophora sp. CONT]|nr:DUF1768-domain-containing protein [Peniophora sp. CONT]